MSGPTGQDHSSYAWWNPTVRIRYGHALDGQPTAPGTGVKVLVDPVSCEVALRRVRAGEFPDLIVAAVQAVPDPSDPHHAGSWHIDAMDGGHLRNTDVIDGTAGGVREHDAVYWRPSIPQPGDAPSIPGLSVERGRDGVLIGYVQRSAYSWPTSADLAVNKLYVVPDWDGDSVRKVTVAAPMTGLAVGDRLLVQNPRGSNTRLTLDSTPNQGGGELILSPGDFVSAVWTGTVWTRATDVESVVVVDATFNIPFMERNRPPARLGLANGDAIARSGNVRSNRVSTARFTAVAGASGYTVSGAKITAPDPRGELGVVVDVYPNADGTGDRISRTLVPWGESEHVYARTGSGAKYVTVRTPRDSQGRQTIELIHPTGDTSDWGGDAHLFVSELVVR